MKYFLDCGFYAGKALEYYAPFIDDTWKVIAFEPNTELDVEAAMSKFSFPIEWVKKAVWVRDGSVAFRIGGRNDASHVDVIRPSQAKKVRVPSINFSKFVAELPDVETIVCSMDIEGSEYPVLRKMLKDKTARKLSLLDIEFHHRLMDNSGGEATSLLRRELEAEGVLVKLKLEI